jgi:hypothetical protein
VLAFRDRWRVRTKRKPMKMVAVQFVERRRRRAVWDRRVQPDIDRLYDERTRDSPGAKR